MTSVSAKVEDDVPMRDRLPIVIRVSEIEIRVFDLGILGEDY